MDITSGQRTYYLGVSANGVSSFDVDIPFRDSAGNLIDCNYFRIDGTTNQNNGAFVAELSGVSKAGNMTSLNLRSLRVYTNIAPSGILGVGGALVFGQVTTAQWHGCNGEICTGIKLRVDSNAGSQFFGITYGNLIPYNVLRTNAYDKGV